MTTYSGKYPLRIKAVYSLKGQKGVIGVTTNDGQRFTITAASTKGVMPKIGTSVGDYEATFVEGAAQ